MYGSTSRRKPIVGSGTCLACTKRPKRDLIDPALGLGWRSKSTVAEASRTGASPSEFKFVFRCGHRFFDDRWVDSCGGKRSCLFKPEIQTTGVDSSTYGLLGEPRHVQFGRFRSLSELIRQIDDHSCHTHTPK